MNRKIYPFNENVFGMNYQVFYPDNYEDLPLLVYLHGAGERGKKVDNLNRHAVPMMITNGEEIPAVVLCPQCPEQVVWNNIPDKVKAIIDSVAVEYGIKRDRICITGSSMGGFGTWMMGKTYPNFFSAIGPVAGGGMSWRAKKLVNTPVMAVHGTADTVVPPIYSELMVNAINKNGGNAELILLDGAGHNDGVNNAYLKTDLISWLLKQRRENFDRVVEPCEEMF